MTWSPVKLHQHLLADVALEVVALELDLVGAGLRQVAVVVGLHIVRRPERLEHFVACGRRDGGDGASGY
jgi:hypothetical protein